MKRDLRRNMLRDRVVEKMSGAFIDMAMQVNAPVVPIRFVGGLPADPMDRRIEFPLGMGTQDIYIGRPMPIEQFQHWVSAWDPTRIAT